MRRVAQSQTQCPVESQEVLCCCLCGTAEKVILYRGRAPSRTSDTDIWRCTSPTHGDFTQIVRCPRCRLVYQDPRDPLPVIEGGYRMVVDEVYLHEAASRVSTFEKSLERIEALRATGRLLDVGCYTGVFISVASRSGWDCIGIEPSTWAADYARGQGLRVLNHTLREANLESGLFDVITMWDVIEHLPDPVEEIRECYRLLKPGGLLCLSTMNVESAFARLLGKRWPWYMRMHLYYFSPLTISRLLEMAGFSVRSISRHKRIVSVKYLLQKIGCYSSFAEACLAMPLKLLGMSERQVTVDFGDIMDVIAEKPAMSST